MPQKGFKKDDGVWGRREKISSKVFPFFPDHNNSCIETRDLSDGFKGFSVLAIEKAKAIILLLTEFFMKIKQKRRRKRR